MLAVCQKLFGGMYPGSTDQTRHYVRTTAAKAHVHVPSLSFPTLDLRPLSKSEQAYATGFVLQVAAVISCSQPGGSDIAGLCR